MTRLYVPADTAALAAGADETAAALRSAAAARGVELEIVRNGSRGMLWLEPMVEAGIGAGRTAFGPVSAEDAASVLDAILGDGAHPLALGRPCDMPWLARQERLTFARVGVIDPLDLADYEAHGGLAGLRRALEMEPAAICAEVLASGLRGRGGAGFPAGIKWKTVLDQSAAQKYVCCNADEGDSGTFADRMLMEGDPFVLIEAMIIAGLATGATAGYVYIRSEYPRAISQMKAAIAVMEAAGWLGDDVGGSGRAFRLAVRRGAGAYICGEESSMLNSIEGLRGTVRVKPPIPAIAGLFGQPTVINNVPAHRRALHLAADGAKRYADFGMGAPAAPCRSSSPATSATAASSARRHDAGDHGRHRRRHGSGPAGHGRRWAASRLVSRPLRHALRRIASRRATGSSAMAGSWSSTTPPTWRGRPASPSNSAKSRAAANARPAGSARCVAARRWRRSCAGTRSPPISRWSRICAN